MTALKDRLKALIHADGPMPISAYMTTCLHDPQHGYYATRPGLGADFTTAPEISQIFGELLGLWAAHEWQAMDMPQPVNLAELGPGHATLLTDALRASRAIDGFHQAMQLTLIEASPALRAVQTERLHDHIPAFHTELTQMAPGPAIILANEYLDCLPARQFVNSPAGWVERVVGLDAEGELAFGLAADRVETVLPTPANTAAVELQPSLDTLVDQLKQRVDAGHSLRALFIDYGPASHAPGDTLRAYQNGVQVHPLAAPGQSDLTVDVDFSRLKQLAETAGLTVHGPVPQGQFLISLGAETRLNQLAKSQPDDADQLYAATRKLVDPVEMGTRFQVICLSSAGLPIPAGFET